MSATADTIPARPPAPPKNGRAFAAFGLSLGIHALFFGLIAWSLRGEQRPIVVPIELVFGLASPAVEIADAPQTPESSEASASAPLAPDGVEPPRPELEHGVSRVAKPGNPVLASLTDARPTRMVTPQLPDAPNASAHAADAVLELAVYDWLKRHQRYPRAARRAGLEGTARVRFVIDRRGVLRERELVASSGHAVLDRAALELLERAAPYPALPARVAIDAVELTLPVEYRLNADATRG